MIFQRSCRDIIIKIWCMTFAFFLWNMYVHPMFCFLLCQIWKVKAKSKLIKFWWFEIKLASQKIVVMEEGKIDELVYNDVVDILNLRFWTWQEREACCIAVLKSINFILIPWIDLFGQYHVETWQNIKFLVRKTAANKLIYFKW